ncbi:pilus biosynthesis protein [Litchfieldella qijiaojingensis]|uniref:Pilus biosynthesis protein n=1 Tax=Litchfieldella qijiaojingensis TaxID=980347 RepID=A0ABQ2Z417_9GAMM|nr:pilus biosynthesis protein [Halomonas qijiaojingensis]
MVIAILASIAYPHYTDHVERARRVDGQSMLMQVASRLERCYTASSSYEGCVPGLDSSGMASESGHYTVTATTLTSTTFALSAIPQEGQAGDRCGSLSLNHRGERAPDDCW